MEDLMKTDFDKYMGKLEKNISLGTLGIAIENYQTQIEQLNMSINVSALGIAIKNYQTQIEKLNLSTSLRALGSAMKNYQDQMERLNINASVTSLGIVMKNYQNQIGKLNISKNINIGALSSVMKDYQSRLKIVETNFDRLRSLDLKTLDKVILSYDNSICDSNEHKQVNVTKVKNEEINLNEINNIISSKLEEKSKDCITIANTIIYWLKDISEGQDKLINRNCSINFKQALITILLGLLTNLIFLLGQNFYNHSIQNINANQIIQSVKKEFKQITLDYNNKFNYDDFMYSNKDKLEVRNRNSAKSFVIYKLDVGSIVQIIEKRKEWIKITFIDRNSLEENEGWVLSKYLRKLKK